MTDLDTLEPDTAGFDRRAALKKAALAAGVVAWTTPVVQAVLPGVASAAGASCTGCGFTGGLSFTGPSCSCLPTVCSSCCDAQTVLAVATCGPTGNCGTMTVSGCILRFFPVGVSGPGWYANNKPGCPVGGTGGGGCQGFPNVDLGNCNADPKFLWVNVTVISTSGALLRRLTATTITGYVTVSGCLPCGGQVTVTPTAPPGACAIPPGFSCASAPFLCPLPGADLAAPEVTRRPTARRRCHRAGRRPSRSSVRASTVGAIRSCGIPLDTPSRLGSHQDRRRMRPVR